MTGPGVAAVVVSHESQASIEACLARLRAATGIAEIRVVDNASTDDTVAVVQRHALEDARLRFIANPDNPGFATACNQGAADSSAPWLAFVNPDCMVEADTFEALLRHAGTLGGEVLLGADLVDGDGTRDGAAQHGGEVGIVAPSGADARAVPVHQVGAQQHLPAQGAGMAQQ